MTCNAVGLPSDPKPFWVGSSQYNCTISIDNSTPAATVAAAPTQCPRETAPPSEASGTALGVNSAALENVKKPIGGRLPPLGSAPLTELNPLPTKTDA